MWSERFSIDLFIFDHSSDTSKQHTLSSKRVVSGGTCEIPPPWKKKHGPVSQADHEKKLVYPGMVDDKFPTKTMVFLGKIIELIADSDSQG